MAEGSELRTAQGRAEVHGGSFLPVARRSRLLLHVGRMNDGNAPVALEIV